MNLGMDQARRLPHYIVSGAAASAAAMPPLSARLAQAILDLAECAEIDVANSILVTGAISTGHLAVLAGGKPQAVARMIERFISQGLVEKRRERLILRRPEKLRGIVAKAA